MAEKMKTTVLFFLLFIGAALLPLVDIRAQEETGCCAAVPNDPLISPFAEITDQYHCNFYTQLGNTVQFYTDREVSSDGKTCESKTISSVLPYCRWERLQGGECSHTKYPNTWTPYLDRFCAGDFPGSGYGCCCDQAITNANDPLAKNNTTQKPPEPREIIAPILSVSIPGLTKFTTVNCDDKSPNCSIPWIAEYIGAIFKYSMIAIAILAVIVMMIGGVIWITAGSNSGRITQAKDFIKNGLLGTTLALCSYLALYLINPNLTILPPINVGYIEQIDLDRLDSPDAGSNSLPPGQNDGKCLATGSLNDLNSIAQKYTNNKVTYRYGATGGDCTVRESGKECACPSGQLCFDCSNFIRHMLSCVGKSGPSGTTSDIFNGAEKITSFNGNIINGKVLQPGDLVGWPKAPSGGNTGHVVLYIGNGQIVESHGGSGRNGNAVKISSLEDYLRNKTKKNLHVRRGS